MELVLNQQAFLDAAPRVLIDRNLFAVGRIRRRQIRSNEEIIIDQWSVTSTRPNGTTRSPLSDWAVMACDFDGSVSALSTLQQLTPKRSQTLVVIVLDGQDHSRCSAVVKDHNDRVWPVSIRFIGPGMLHLKPQHRLERTLVSSDSAPRRDENRLADSICHDETSDSSDVRESRTRGALSEAFDRLKQMRFAIVGCGGGGAELARHLVASGARNLLVIDGDRIGPENLDRMSFANPDAVGEWKAIALANSLVRNQPEATVSCVTDTIQSENGIRSLRDSRFDAVFSFVDSDVARLAVSRLCQETENIHIDVGTLIERIDDARSIACDIRLFEPRQGCVACVPQMNDLDSVMYEMFRPSNCMHRGEPVAWDVQRAGSLLHVNSMAAALATETWLWWMEGSIPTSYWLRSRWAPTGFETRSSVVTPNPSCPFCSEL
jgi:molybdopterin/thiamine biosynthesis adenylyltransferase